MFPSLIHFAQAAVTLPNLNSGQDLGQFMQSVYSFSITIVGILVFVRFIWAGWIYLTAAGNSSKTSKGKDMMTSAIIGAVLLFSAYLILYIINPDLVKNSFDFGKLLTENQKNTQQNQDDQKNNPQNPDNNDDIQNGDTQNPDLSSYQINWDNIQYGSGVTYLAFSITPTPADISENNQLTFTYKFATSIYAIDGFCNKSKPLKFQLEFYRVDNGQTGFFDWGITGITIVFKKEYDGNTFGIGKITEETATIKLNEVQPVNPKATQVQYTMAASCYDAARSSWTRMNSLNKVIDVAP